MSEGSHAGSVAPVSEGPVSEGPVSEGPVSEGPLGEGPNRAGSTREVDDFIYLISHDVRNSVRALIEVPQWIAEDLAEAGQPVEGSLAENLGLMRTHALRLDRMLLDLLTYSRIGRMQEIRRLDLAAAVRKVLAELDLPDDIRLEIDLRVPEIRLGERDLPVLLTALFSNALRHRDARTRCISLSSRSEGGRTILRFGDDGPGIPAPYREKVFHAMTTLRARDEVEGSGMGLAQLRKILQTYGGSLTWIDRPDGRGVVFDIGFPG